jgi:hypothetical protein
MFQLNLTRKRHSGRRAVFRQLDRPMAQRDRPKTKQASGRDAGVAAVTGGLATLESRLKILESELTTARARIRELEDCRIEAANRIDWVIDSLHNVIEKRG